MKKLRVIIEGKSYDVLVEVLEDSSAVPAPASVGTSRVAVPEPVAAQPAVVAAPPPAPANTKAPAGAAGDVKCPLTGKVVSIDVKVGDTVQQGAQVATVEAMKMNTYVYAPCSGKVSAVLVNPGDGVEEGAALLRVE